LQSHQQCRNVPLSPHPRQHMLSPEFLILANSNWCEVESQGCFNFISLMIKDDEHFFRCFSAFQYSSGENSLFSSEPHLFEVPFVGSLSYNTSHCCLTFLHKLSQGSSRMFTALILRFMTLLASLIPIREGWYLETKPMFTCQVHYFSIF
jgi:hypothetical protein